MMGQLNQRYVYAYLLQVLYIILTILGDGDRTMDAGTPPTPFSDSLVLPCCACKRVIRERRATRLPRTAAACG